VRQSIELTERDGVPICRGESLDEGPQDVSYQHLCLRLALRRQRTVPSWARGAIGLELPDGVTLPFAHVVRGGGIRNPGEPRSEALLVLQILAVAPDAKKDFLDDVIGIGARR
jgi:hypothetical protein